MNCIVPVTWQCPGLLTGNRHRNSRSTRFQVIQKPGFSRSTRIQTLNSRFRFGATDIWSRSRSHRFGSDSKPGVDPTGCQPCMGAQDCLPLVVVFAREVLSLEYL